MGEMVLSFTIAIGICGLAMVVVEKTVRYMWYLFKYRVMGWRPDIYDPETVEYISEECAISATNDQIEKARERGIESLSDDTVRDLKADFKEMAQTIIRFYCVEFKWQGKATKTPVKIS